MKRILTLCLVLVFSLGLLAGCAQTTQLRSYSEDALNADPGQLAYGAYAPDTVVMTINGTDVRWDEFAFWLCTKAEELAEADGTRTVNDWDAVYDEETGETYAQALLRMVLEELKQFHAIQAKAASFDMELGEDGEAYVEQSLDETMQTLGADSEQTSADRMRRAYLDTDVLRYQAEVSYYYLLLYQELFGADGEKLSADELNDYVAQNGYMTVKHILLGTVDANGNPLPDDEKERKFKQATRIIDRLNAIEDPTERLAAFDRYAAEYNEDPGVASYPNGYCFLPGQMTEAFETASAALEPYAVTPEPVESEYGYHVILRLPTTGTDVLDYNTDGSPYLLQSDAAQMLYTQMVHAWIDDAEVVWKPEFENLDVQALFTEEETLWEKLDFLHWFH